MFALASSTIRIDCPGPKAFGYVSDLEQFADWFPGVIAIVGKDDLPPATVGRRYSETVAVPLRGRRQVTIRVVDVDAPRRLVTEGDLPALLPRMEIDIREVGTHTCEVCWRMFSRTENALTRRVVLPWARRLMRRRAEIGLRNLKRRLESAGATA